MLRLRIPTLVITKDFFSNCNLPPVIIKSSFSSFQVYKPKRKKKREEKKAKRSTTKKGYT